MHGGQKWFRCANADRQIDQGCRKTLRTHPVSGCWCFRIVPASPTTGWGIANDRDHLAPEEQVPRGLPPVRAWRALGRRGVRVIAGEFPAVKREAEEDWGKERWR